MFFYFWLIVLYIPLLLIYPCRVIGKKNLPKKGRLIFSANHQTLNDPIIIAYKLCKRRFRFMAKAPLFKNKIAGAILKGMGAYPVNKKLGFEEPVQLSNYEHSELERKFGFLKK